MPYKILKANNNFIFNKVESHSRILNVCERIISRSMFVLLYFPGDNTYFSECDGGREEIVYLGLGVMGGPNVTCRRSW